MIYNIDFCVGLHLWTNGRFIVGGRVTLLLPAFTAPPPTSKFLDKSLNVITKHLLEKIFQYVYCDPVASIGNTVDDTERHLKSFWLLQPLVTLTARKS